MFARRKELWGNAPHDQDSPRVLVWSRFVFDLLRSNAGPRADCNAASNAGGAGAVGVSAQTRGADRPAGYRNAGGCAAAGTEEQCRIPLGSFGPKVRA